jgi:lipopolysaccharide/colanic/teichoic acid biosynthesis glycosyltransferase
MRVLRPVDDPNAFRRCLESHGLAALPQLLNVLKGDMSFVGPRALAPEEASALSSRAVVRLDARPGVTGPARIALADALEGQREPAERGNGDLVNLETYYVQNWSLSEDVKILLRWIGRCLSGRCRGA